METAINDYEFTVQDYLANGTAADIFDCIVEHATYVAKHDIFDAVFVEFDDNTSYIFTGIDADIIIDVCKHEGIPF